MSLASFVRGLRAGWTKDGFQPDDTPVAIPAGFEIPETLEQKIARVVRSDQMTRFAQQQDADSFDEFDDFNDDDDVHRFSPYEVDELTPIEARKPSEDGLEPPGGVEAGASTKPPEKADKEVPEKKPSKRVKRVITEEFEDE